MDPASVAGEDVDVGARAHVPDADDAVAAALALYEAKGNVAAAAGLRTTVP